MTPTLEELLASQGGLVKRRQLVKGGYSQRTIQRAVASGQLRPVARGLYASGAPHPTEALRGAVLRLGAVASHQSAALLWGMELVQVDLTPHVAVTRMRSRAKHPEATVHRMDLPSDAVTSRDGITITTPTRTVLDLARVLPLREAVAVADSALRQHLVTVQELVDGLNALVGAGRAKIAKVIALVDPSAGSVLESLARVLFAERGLPPPTSQLFIRTTCGWSGRVDFTWPLWRLIVEVDGFDFHSDRAAFRRDRRRDNALQRAGWRVIRLTYEDVVHYPDATCALLSSLLTDRATAA